MASAGWSRVAALAGLTIVIIAVLAGLGALLAPSWERPTYPDQPRVLPAVPPSGAPAGSNGRLPHEDLEVKVADTTLGATVVSPPGEGPHPALVFVHGGGSATRAAYLDQAERMAELGVVAVIYDKRTVGYTFRERDYGQLADDALAMAQAVSSRPDVDPDRVGLWGISEGGWVVPLAAGRGTGVGYVVLAAAPTVSPGAQLSWALDDGLRRQDAPDGARRLAARALALGEFDYVRHDPLPPLRGVRQPVLAYYPTLDRAVPPAQSARMLADTLDAAGNRAYTIRFIIGADHGMRVDGELAPGYLTGMASWIHDLPDLPQPQVAGPEPVQHALAVAQPTELLRAPVVAGLLMLIAVGYLAGPLAGAAARRRGHRSTMPPPLRRRLRWAVASGLSTVVGLNVVIGLLVTVAFAGGPTGLPTAAWVLLRLAAVGTVVLAVVAGTGVVDAWRGGWRPSGADRTALVGATGATGLVLLLAGYWELFALGW